MTENQSPYTTQLHEDLAIKCGCGVVTNLDLAKYTFSYKNDKCIDVLVDCQARCVPCGKRFSCTKRMDTPFAVTRCICNACSHRKREYCAICAHHLQNGGCLKSIKPFSGIKNIYSAMVTCGDCGNCYYEVCYRHYAEMGDQDETLYYPCQNRKY